MTSTKRRFARLQDNSDRGVALTWCRLRLASYCTPVRTAGVDGAASLIWLGVPDAASIGLY